MVLLAYIEVIDMLHTFRVHWTSESGNGTTIITALTMGDAVNYFKERFQGYAPEIQWVEELGK